MIADRCFFFNVRIVNCDFSVIVCVDNDVCLREEYGAKIQITPLENEQ
jgi:hypothetical protein